MNDVEPNAGGSAAGERRLAFSLLTVVARARVGSSEWARPSVCDVGDYRDALPRGVALARPSMIEVLDASCGGLVIRGAVGRDGSRTASQQVLCCCCRWQTTTMGPFPEGTAVHTGQAFVGPTGPAGVVEDFTALGDVVNSTARLASAARAGEVLVSTVTTEAAGTVVDGLERRSLPIRGREATIDVVVLRQATAATAT